MATIFTAHATVLGRDLCDRGYDLYRVIEKIDAENEASGSLLHRHAIERLAAQNCGILTAVSEITSIECEHLLGRASDAVLPNGMNLSSRLTAGGSSNVALRYNSKVKIREFVHGHFYGQLDTFNAQKALYFFLAGRYEYSNKGADVYIEALARLNKRLKAEKDGLPSVVAFIVMPANVDSISTEALHRQATLKTVEQTVGDIERDFLKKLRDRALVWRPGQQVPTETELITQRDNAALRRCLYGIKTSELPPLATHNIVHRRDDPILNHLHAADLLNREEDRVKVVFHPDFLNPSSSVFPIDYNEFIRGAHLGVFPSKYEPWGYTPAECLVKGVPAIASNLSGFGNHMERLLRDVSASEHGLYIVDRRKTDFEGAVQQTMEYMYGFCRSKQRERIEQRNRADRLGEFLDWAELHGEYGKARKMALERKYGRVKGGKSRKEPPRRLPEIRQRSELSLSSYEATPDLDL